MSVETPAMPLPRAATADEAEPQVIVRSRVESIDALRGLVMVLMALDHVRAFFTNVRFEPLDLNRTWPALFMTRWITHFCAPTFVFLAGTAAYMYGTRGRSKGELSWFLLTRGLWLVVVELTIVRFGWFFNFDVLINAGGVIWAIGWSMVALAAMCRLPTSVVGAAGLGIIALHNAFDPVQPEDFGTYDELWTILHEGGFIAGNGWTFGAFYPLLPWVGVIAAGYAFGAVMQLPAGKRKPVIFRTGLIATLLFVILRWTNLYGNPVPWAAQKSPLFTIFSFIDCWKYPPSLLFLLMTLGPALLFLAWIDGRSLRGAQPLVTIGRVPFFYYVLHLPLIHLLAILLALARGQQIDFLFQNPPEGSLFSPPPGYGYDLAVVYAVWALTILILYPLCRWFAGVKARNKAAWLSYL